jgi:hypothetical protein
MLLLLVAVKTGLCPMQLPLIASHFVSLALPHTLGWMQLLRPILTQPAIRESGQLKVPWLSICGEKLGQARRILKQECNRCECYSAKLTGRTLYEKHKRRDGAANGMIRAVIFPEDVNARSRLRGEFD